MATTKRKKKKQQEPYLLLYKAVAKYIKSVGGSVVVIGGISIGQQPGQKLKYFIQIPITGEVPTFAKEPGGQS